MRTWLTIALLCGLALASTSTAHAQRGRGRYRGGVVMGPDGPLYDTRSPEWRMSGGNIWLYQELMEEKMEREQEQLMLRQMQQTARQQKNQGKAKPGKPGQAGASNPNLTTPPAAGFDDPFAEPVNHYSRRKKRKPPAHAATASPKAGKPRSDSSKSSP
jgi:hypothetical protein